MVISRLVQDDFLMGREREDGHIYFVGGVVAHPGKLSPLASPCRRGVVSQRLVEPSCFANTRSCAAGFYDFSQKIDKSMEQIHVGVPQFNEKILKSVERTLKRFEAHQPFERSSWEMVDDYNLYHRAFSFILFDRNKLTSLDVLFFAVSFPFLPSAFPSQTPSQICMRAVISLMTFTPKTTTSGGHSSLCYRPRPLANQLSSRRQHRPSNLPQDAQVSRHHLWVSSDLFTSAKVPY
jgi:hypothetical protein